jgi:hypothetical protein
MSESVQAVLGVVLIFGTVGSVMVLGFDGVPLVVRLVVPGVTAASLGGLVWSMVRKDKAPDYLRQVSRKFFEKDGFCFALTNRVDGRRCLLLLFYQSRYDRPSRARVVIRPSRGFFLTRPDLESITLTVECPAGGFGVVRFPYGVPYEFQGKTQRLDAAADVTYPEGKGTMIRFKGGTAVGGAKLEAWKVALTVAGALGGQVVIWDPARVKFPLPVGVIEAFPDDAPVETVTLWKLGDDPAKTLQPV